jgi:small subunit ribosomal protein S20
LICSFCYKESDYNAEVDTLANIQSAEKRNRQNEKRRKRNKAVKSKIHTETKKLLSIIDENNQDEAVKHFKLVSGLLDSAAGKGVFHRNNAARKKSHLQKRINRMNQAVSS